MFAADILGYGNIFLAGVDFAFHSGKERFTSWSKNADGEWVASYSFVDPGKQYPLTLNGLQSEDVHIYYKKNMISAWALSGQQMYTTDKGAIVECPYIPIAKVIEQQGQGLEKWNRDTIEEHAQRYLAKVGAFMVESTGGKSFVEVSDDTPLDTLEKFMTEINRKIVCTSCGLEAGVNNRADGKLYDDDIKNALSMECPRCKQKAMKQPAVCDIPKQLKKFDRLLKSSVKLSA